MIEHTNELIVKRSLSFARLCGLILIIIPTIFLYAYFSLPTPHEEIGKEPPLACGNNTTIYSNSPGQKLFKVNCAVCHSVTDQKLTGPGLAGIAGRLPEPAETWFTAWVLNNEKVLKSGDAYARKIFEENGKAPMTVFEGQLTNDQVHEIYVYLTSESSQPIP